jgi:quercetin dioxygenase-like cupin family protein
MEGIMNRRFVVAGAIAAALAGAGIGALRAQQPAPEVKRNIVLKQDMTVPGREAVMIQVEFPPGSAEIRHSHAGEGFGFLVEGTIESEADGKPTVTLKAGDHFYIPPGEVHRAVNKSGQTARADVVFIVEKGKPFSTPAP